ncbi:MAG: hypothetical protein JXA21_15480, partial [Anaerolineae bacterium]|nr:hypothetical protein [Anaerolineae bacterium]
RPAWITEFNAQTGRMCGTPAAAHVGASGAIQLTVTDPSAAADSLTFSIQVNSPTLPCRPTALEFSAALGAGFVQQGIACSNTTLAQAQGMFNSRVLDFTANVTLDYNSRSALLNIQPSSAGLAIGTYNHSIRFTLRGVEYTVPVKLIVTAPPPSTLVLSRSSLDFSARVGESAASQAVTLRSTSAALNWTASANQNWVTLTPANGTATTPPGQISIGIDMTKISAEGPRSAVVTISDQNNKQYLIAITLNVAPAPTQPGGADSGDIVLIALEVTQGLQNWDHEIPLIQGRTTWVRAHVRNRTNAYIEGVTAELEVWRGTTKLGTLAPEPIFSNMGGPLRIFPTGDPSCDEICERQIAIENSFDFKLDDSWTNGALTFKLVGKSHAIACNEQDATKDCRLAASFETQVRPLYKVRYFGATSAQCAELTQIVEQYLPVRIQAVCDPGRYTFLSGALNSNSLSELHKLWVKNGSPADTLYFGLYASGDGGLAYREFPIAGVIDVTKKNSSSLAKGSIMVAHEVLHTFDLGHGYISPNYPPSDPRYPADSRFPKYALSRSAGGLGQLSPDLTGLNAHYGFVTGNILLPEPGYRNDYSYGGVSPIHADVMSGGGAWLSAFTYNWVLNKTAPQQSVQQQTQAALAPAGTALTLVGGRITDTQTAQISALLGVVAEGTILTPEPGAYSVRLLDAGGALVYSVTFDLPAPATSPIDPVPHPDADPAYYFSAPAPYALDGTNAIRQAALFYQGVELDRVTASSAVPTITTWTLTPGFETITATVTATDADNQPLTYRLAYSRDAVTWQEVGNGTVTPQSGSATFDIVVDQNELPGATAHHWQLLVSDGFYTVRAEQAGSFAIANKRPVAWIITYFADNTISGDQVLQWRGTGYDLEDGVLSGDQLIWYSDRDGEIGRGESLFIAADDLSAGLHVVSLEAVDSDGNSSVIVFTGASAIIPAPQMNTDASGSEALNSTVLLQVYRDRPYTPSILSVQDLSLAVPTGALYHATLSVTSIGDDGRLPWTLQTTPPAWLSFDQTSGETPTHINVTVNPATLTPGTTYTGTLTFQAGAPATQTVTTTYSIGIYTPSTFNIYLPLVLRNTP